MNEATLLVVLQRGSIAYSFCRGATLFAAAKKVEPIWVPPDWHYAEVARGDALPLRTLTRVAPVRLRNGTLLEVRDQRVGILEREGRFVPLGFDTEIVEDGALFVPPTGTVNREIEGELGHYALDLGDGYLIHGTPDARSVGEAVTHGCIRLADADIAWLYENVPIGTNVFIY